MTVRRVQDRTNDISTRARLPAPLPAPHFRTTTPGTGLTLTPRSLRLGYQAPEVAVGAFVADRGDGRQLTAVLRDEAFKAMRSGDGVKHDEIIGEALMDLAVDVDVIVLAQASMARVLATLGPGAQSVPVLSSPSSGMARLASVLA
jgi:hypothetical protein